MQFLKKLGRGLSSSLLKLCLFTLAIVASLLMVFGSPTQLKHSLKDSGMYDTLVDNVLQSAQKNSDQNGDSIPVDRPEVKAAIKTAFSPQYLQSNTEQVVDSIYRWLNSDVTNPDFKIDLSTQKQALANALGDYAVSRAQSLPVCTLQQARQLQATSIDPYNVPCVPPGFNLATIHSQVVNDVTQNTDFLDKTVIDANTLAKNNGGQNPFEKADKGRKVYHLFKSAPYVLGGLAILSAGSLILLYDDRRRGLRAIGVIFLGTGIFLFISTWVITYILGHVKTSSGLGKPGTNISFQQNLVSVINSLNNALNHKLFIFCAVYAILGVWILLTLKFLPHHKSETKEEGEAPTHADEPGSELPPPHKPETEPPKTESVPKAKE